MTNNKLLNIRLKPYADEKEILANSLASKIKANIRNILKEKLQPKTSNASTKNQ